MSDVDNDQPQRLPMVFDEIPMEFDSVLQYTHHKRQQLVEGLAKNVTNEDPKVMNVFLKALDGMDKSVVTVKRLGIEEAQQQNAEADTRASADLLKAIGRRMFQADPSTSNRAIPELGDDIPDPIMVPGETEVGVAAMTYDSFKKSLPVQEGS